MHAHTRAVVAASAFAVTTGSTVAGLYDHAAGRHLKIAAEARGDRLQAYDGERSVRFGGTFPDLFDEGDQAFVSFEPEGATVRGYDRGSGSFYEARVTGPLVELYDHGESMWYAFTVQLAPGGSGDRP
jgi:hypothetical protein